MREITDPKTGAILMQPDSTDLEIRKISKKVDDLEQEIAGLRKVIEILVETLTTPN